MQSLSSVGKDPNTFSNYQEVRLNKLHFEWLLDLDQRSIQAIALYDFVVTADELSEVWLDIFQILVVSASQQGTELKHRIDPLDSQVQGDRLAIELPEPALKGETIALRVDYKLDEKAKALNFLTKEQTSGKDHPYMFSQCEMANCRSIIPLQDTPSVKHTYSAKIITKKGISVFMSGDQVPPHSVLHNDDVSDHSVFDFECKIPIPSYLIAIIAGNVQQQQVGPRTWVISEPIDLPAYAKELEDMEDYLITVESYIGPYEWGQYKVVILPPSFPFGGMENPLLTFASPSIMTGDKSGLSVVIHEIVHSWTGNLVTNQNWSNFWLNEGFTQFIERKAQALSKFFGREYAEIDFYEGKIALRDTVNRIGVDHNYTSLSPNTEGVDPDDSFSVIPYEKGSSFLTYLESIIGPDTFQSFLREYIQAFKYQSINASIFKEYFPITLQKTKGQDSTCEVIIECWDKWIKAPGHPPIPDPAKNQRILDAESLAQSYIEGQGNASSYFTFLTNQKYIFLSYLSEHKQGLSKEIIARIDDELKLSVQNNFEILWRWYRLCLQVDYIDNLEHIHRFLGSIGRGKMVLPVYRELVKVNLDKAKEWFAEFNNFYHPLTRNAIGSILKAQQN